MKLLNIRAYTGDYYRAIKGDARSLDYGSSGLDAPWSAQPRPRPLGPPRQHPSELLDVPLKGDY